MKDKDLRLKIKRYSAIGAKHWYVFPNGLPYPGGISRKFGRLKDARSYALKHAYAKNIEVCD